MDVTAIMAWATLAVAFPLNAVAAFLLLKKSRQRPDLDILKERFITAVATTLLVLFFGMVFVNNDQTVPPLGLDTTKWITRGVLLAVALVVGGGWLRIWWHGRVSDKRQTNRAPLDGKRPPS